MIGPNGVGKSTLFKTIVGLEPLTSGSLKIGDTVKISYVDQNRAGLDPNKNLWEAVSDGLDFIEVAGVEVPTRAYVASFGFKGSHDRWFLDRVATHILAWEGTDENPANWYWFEGNFQAYQENRIARLGEDAARPHRLHRKLTR